MIPVRPLLVGNSPALAAAELGPTDCTNAPEETLRALATWSVDSCKTKQEHLGTSCVIPPVPTAVLVELVNQ